MVLDKQFSESGTVSLSGSKLVFESSGVVTVDLKTGEETNRYDALPESELPFNTYMVVALNEDRTRVMWTREVARHATVDQLGDKLLVSVVPLGSD